MSKRKNYGTLLLLSSLILGVFLLTGSFIWMQDKANMLLAVFVLVLYGVGQWLTVAYWQRIQADWEATGLVLEKLQQAVGEIPAALDANLKAIGARLAEGQQKALEHLQGQVNDGARLALEKGSAMMGEQASRFQAMAEAAGEGWRKSSDVGGEVLARTLDQHLAKPLEALQATFGQWQAKVDAQMEASKGLWTELGKAQKAWSEKIQTMAGEIQDKLVEAAGQEGRRLGDSLSAAAADMLTRLESLQAKRMAAESEVLAGTLAGLKNQGGALQESAARYREGLEEAREAMMEWVREAGEKSAESQARLVEALSESQGAALAEASRALRSQGDQDRETARQVAELAGQMRQGSEDFRELVHLSRINQTEMQAGVEMLNAGLASILDRLEKQASAGDGQQVFLAELGQALGAFQERASEALVENSLKTQEILMEVLNLAERRAAEGRSQVGAPETVGAES